MEALKKVMDPELGISIVDMQLVDNVKIDNGDIIVDFHLTSPHCPFINQITSDIENTVLNLKSSKKQSINCANLGYKVGSPVREIAA